MSFQPISAIPPLIPGDANFESIYTQSLVSFNTIEVNEIITNVVTGLLPPVNGTDATNKNYVDYISNSHTWKNPVRLSTTTEDLTLAGTGQFIDGVMTLVGDRILVKNQSDTSENGIYSVSTGTWLRTTDADITIPATGAYTYVVSGAVNQTKLFVCQTPSSFFGNAITFTLFSSGGGGGTPGGPSNGSVQFNNAGSFTGSSNFQWSSGILTVTGAINSTSVSSSGLNIIGNSNLQVTTVTDLNITGIINIQNLLVLGISSTSLNVSGPSVVSNLTATGLNVSGSSIFSGISSTSLNVSGLSNFSNLTTTNITTSNINVSNNGSIVLGASSSIILDGTSSRITGLPIPINNSEAASKAYVDAQVGSNPGGTEGSIQYNSGGLFTGDTNFKWSGTQLTILGTTLTNGQFTSNNTIDSVSPVTGSVVLAGGLGMSGNLHVAAGVYADGFFTTSDVMCKTDINPLYNSIDILNKIECCSYKLKGHSEINYGVLAQQLDNIGLSHLVNKTDKYKSVNYIQLIALLISSIQEISSDLELVKKMI